MRKRYYEMLISILGILQSPFFNLDYPKSINYGAMGVVMGHELSHAFDDQGKEFDENGNMRDWWTNNTLNEFKKLTQCMANQYSDYKLAVKSGKWNCNLKYDICCHQFCSPRN